MGGRVGICTFIMSTTHDVAADADADLSPACGPSDRSGSYVVSPSMLDEDGMAGAGGAGDGLLAAACSRWSRAFKASARLRSASARVAPPPPRPPSLLAFMMLGRPPSARALACSFPASMSSAEKGVQTLSATRVLYSWSDSFATGV